MKCERSISEIGYPLVLILILYLFYLIEYRVYFFE